MTKLEKMLKYVSEHNEFYKNRIKEYGIKDPLDITQWPVLTRKELQENRYNMFSDGYRDKFYRQQLHRQASSGSSGVPVNVYWDEKDWYRSNMALWRKRLKWYGIHPNDKYVVFTLNAFNIKASDNAALVLNEPSNVLIVNVSLIHNVEGEISIAKAISDFDPEWLYIQPFILNKLIQTFENFKIKKPSKLRYIESVGEILSNDLRKRAYDCFGVNLVNLYGSEEFNGIAYENNSGRMEILDDNVYVEVLECDGVNQCGKGEAIITSVNNYAMPLIRYNLKDIIAINKHNVTGMGIKYVDKIVGRAHKSIEFDGLEINSFMLAEIISEVNNEIGDPIKEYEFIYYTKDKRLCCNIVVSMSFKNWINAITACVKRKFVEKLGMQEDIVFDVQMVTSILSNGKKHTILYIK